MEDANAGPATAGVAMSEVQEQSSTVPETVVPEPTEGSPSIDASAEGASPAKKTKIDGAPSSDKDDRGETILNKHAKTFDVYGRVAQSQALKLFLDAISLIIPEGSFEITKNNSFCGITLESVDLARSCLVQGRLSCQIEDGSGADECKRCFCVRVQALKDCLKTASGHHFVDIWLNDSGELNVKIFEPDIGGFAPEFNIRTLFKENEKIPISNLNYEFYVEINIKMFQQIMKLCRDHKSDTIKLEVGETDADTIFFVMSYESDEVNGYFPIYSSSGTEKDGEQNITHIKASDDVVSSKINRENIKIKYSDRFSSEYLNLFTKNMDRHFVSLRLAAGKPLLVDYPLGIAGNDRIRFILAPKEG